MKRVVITSGYFNPLHVGHIRYLDMSAKLGDTLCVIVNNDRQVKVKGSRPFMSEDDRLEIIQNLKPVDLAVISIDEDGTVCKSIERLFNVIKDSFSYGPETEVVFAKGGDRNSGNIPEKETCDKLGIVIVDGLGEKIRASSEILKQNDSKDS